MYIYVKEIGKYLKKVIKERNTNAATVAKELCISPSSLSDILNDKAAPSFVSKLEMIADFLNIDLMTIVFKKDYKHIIKDNSIDYNLDYVNIKDVSPHVKTLIFKLIEEDIIARNRNDIPINK